VRHYGHVADAEAQRLQTEADILFLPLAFDSPAPEVVRTALPGKFAEYLASGRPMLVHAPPDSFVAWYCRCHQCAVVVDKTDPRGLAGGLERLATDPQFRCAIVAAALDRARKDFDPAIAQRNFLAVVAGTG
jgi:glycosyltransferase involved in cell wall biosynthesis